MNFLFCADTSDPSRVEPFLAREREAADRLGVKSWLLDHDAAARGKASEAIQRVPAQAARTTAVYRGWMLRPDQYGATYESLLAKNIALVNDPDQYERVHTLPGWYGLLEGRTPRSVWTRGNPPFEEIMRLLMTFGSRPVLLKDYVKSQKHDWSGACFIPDASNPAEVRRVLDGFLDWTGSDINGGLVFREFVALERLGLHPKSKTPLSREFRLWFLRGKLFSSMPYWEEIEDRGEGPPGSFAEVGKNIPAGFFTMDVARTVDGTWTIIELGEGQVSGLPANQDPTPFLESIVRGMNG